MDGKNFKMTKIGIVLKYFLCTLRIWISVQGQVSGLARMESFHRSNIWLQVIIISNWNIYFY